MKRTLKVIVVVSLMMLSSGMLLAQENPFVGTWKLNTGKTKFTGMPALKSETRTVAAQDSGIKVSFDGIGADGSKFSYSYTTNLDGRATPITGTGVPAGAEMYASKRVDANTYSTTWLKGGKEVGMSRSVASKDGKATTITLKLTDASGKPISAVTVFDKQ